MQYKLSFSGAVIDYTIIAPLRGELSNDRETEGWLLQMIFYTPQTNCLKSAICQLPSKGSYKSQYRKSSFSILTTCQ